MARLTALSLPISEYPGSNPLVDNLYLPIIHCSLFVENTKIKKKGHNLRKRFEKLISINVEVIPGA